MAEAIKNQPKSVVFFEILRKSVASNFIGYGTLLLDISRLDFYVKDQKESVNVYEDVKKIVNREMAKMQGERNKEVLKRIEHIAELRIAHLKGENTGVLTYEDAEKFVKNFKYYPEIFSEKTLKEALKNRKLKDFAEIQSAFGGNIDYFRSQGYLEVGSGIRKKKEHSDGWERTIDAQGVDFLVPSQYQTKESLFLTNCLYIEYPYLKKYPITVYNLDNGSYKDFYVDVKDNKGNKKGCLYVPFKALKDKNPQLITERMTTYFGWYYKNKPEKLEETLNLLKTKIAKELFNDIKGGK